jgi:hypothetical protein
MIAAAAAIKENKPRALAQGCAPRERDEAQNVTRPGTVSSVRKVGRGLPDAFHQADPDRLPGRYYRQGNLRPPFDLWYNTHY